MSTTFDLALGLGTRDRRDAVPRAISTPLSLVGVILVAGLLVPVVDAHEARHKSEGALAKVDSELSQVWEASVTGVDPRFPDLDPRGEVVAVELTVSPVTDDTLTALAAAGLDIHGAYPAYERVEGAVALADLPEVASHPAVLVVHRLHDVVTSAGFASSQGDASIRADDARVDFAVDGSGVTVGVVSDSFDTSSSGDSAPANCVANTVGEVTVTGLPAQALGDLPPSVLVIDDDPGETDEGRAMMEIVHDVAPGADLVFHTGLGGQGTLATAIDRLVECGADVIVDDITVLGAPMFQDGPVATAVRAAAAAGVVVVSAAGNRGIYGVDDEFEDSGVDAEFAGFGGDLHDFGGDDPFAAVELDPGEGVRFVFQWNDPFAGGGSSGARSDYDLWVVDAPSVDASILSFSATSQGCSLGPDVRAGDPLEITSYTNTGDEPMTVYLAVSSFCQGSRAARHLRVATFPTTGSIEDAAFESDIFREAQIYGHTAVSTVVTVGAVDFCELDGLTTPGDHTGSAARVDVERFSSLGGDLVSYFDAAGRRLAGGSAVVPKPDLAGPDGVNTTFFGGPHGSGCGENDEFPNFVGTSAAAAHVAGVAALVLDRSPGMSASAVAEVLKATAGDVERRGFDFLSGHGVVRARSAVGAELCNGLVATIVGTSGPDTIQGTSGADVIAAGAGADVVDGGGGADVICGGDGDDVLSGSSGNDVIVGGAGDDTIRGGRGRDELLGADGFDLIDGGAAADTISGGAGDDVLRGSGGDDVITGGAGADVIRGGIGLDTIAGGTGDDTVFGQGSDDVIEGGAGDDVLKGGIGADRITGGDGDDVLKGGFGNDRLDGQRGRDEVRGQDGVDGVRGGAGDDLLDGGPGADTIRGGSGDDSLVGGEDDDRLFGQTGIDAAFGGPGRDQCRAETVIGCE